MIIRTYIDKDNTLISGSEINTGRNPVAELYYGGEGNQRQFTRHIFHFDVTKLKDQYNSGN